MILWQAQTLGHHHSFRCDSDTRWPSMFLKPWWHLYQAALFQDLGKLKGLSKICVCKTFGIPCPGEFHPCANMCCCMELSLVSKLPGVVWTWHNGEWTQPPPTSWGFPVFHWLPPFTFLNSLPGAFHSALPPSKLIRLPFPSSD